jgi:hypothetical protein
MVIMDKGLFLVTAGSKVKYELFWIDFIRLSRTLCCSHEVHEFGRAEW